MTDRAPSEQQRTCRGIQGGGSHALVSRHVLQAHRSTLDLTGPAREDGRDPQVQRLCEPAPLAPGLGRSRKFSGIRKTHCSFRTQRCPNLSGAEADSEMGVQRGQRPSGGPRAAPGFWEGKDAPRTWWQPPGEREVTRKFETSHVGGATGRTPPIPRSALEKNPRPEIGRAHV